MKRIFLPIMTFLTLATISAKEQKCFGEKPHPDTVGDIVFADGTAMAWREGLSFTDEQKAAAIAVIFYVGSECSNDGRERMLGVGLVRSNDYASWCDSDAWAYCEYIKPIECSINGYIGKYTFEGDTDGSDNLEQIGACLSTRAQNLTDDEVAYWYPAGRPFDDTETESLYPAFYFAKNYAKQSKSHVYGTRYEKGWYLPSIAELFQIWKNKETVDAAIRLCGGDEFGEWHYLSSTQFTDKTDYTYELYFFTGSEHGRKKYFGEFVCAIREFDGRRPTPQER